MVFTLPFGGLVAPHWRLDAIGSLLILGILRTGLAYVLNYRLIADEGPAVASTTTYLLPLVAVVLGALVVNETVTVAMIAGMIVVLGGVALVQRRPANAATAIRTLLPQSPSRAEGGTAMVVVDVRFPHLLKDLRHDRGLSLRELSARVAYRYDG
jgi:hypothetical protein